MLLLLKVLTISRSSARIGRKFFTNVMVNEEQLALLKQGAKVWNCWREKNQTEKIDLQGVDLIGADLTGVNLKEANLVKADLTAAILIDADFAGANFAGASLHSAEAQGADFTGVDFTLAMSVGAIFSNATLAEANLYDANFYAVNFWEANLKEANLYRTNLASASFSKATLTNARLGETVFGDTDLADAGGLETCYHSGPSTLDFRSIARSGTLPLAFLRGCGLPDNVIDYLPSLLNQPIQFYSCFISYSSKDQEFVERLHADLQNKGVRCWYAPEDLPIGAKIRVGIDEAIRKHDKLLLVLSEASVNSQWVEQEVETALEQERQQNRIMLFPIRLDDSVMLSRSGWANLIKNSRNVGDFRYWKDHEVYQKWFTILLRDLKVAG